LLKKFKRPKVPFKKKRKLKYKDYKRMCKFIFNVVDYPKEFNLKLIDNFGWYNNNKNPNGISRDHMFSIRDGWINNISPKIIRHPANCKLMMFEDNNKKGPNSSLDFETLVKRINTWDKKYK
jgi:hypothetical protein